MTTPLTMNCPNCGSELPVGAKLRMTLVLSPVKDWNVIVFVWEVFLISGIVICSVYVPEEILNITGPSMPQFNKASTASLKVE